MRGSPYPQEQIRKKRATARTRAEAQARAVQHRGSANILSVQPRALPPVDMDQQRYAPERVEPRALMGYQRSSGGHSRDETEMAEFINVDSAKSLILEAVKQKNPSIQPGEIFDWLIVSNRLRHVITTEEFIMAMRALGEADMIAADETNRHFVLTEKGFEEMGTERLAAVA
jgi:hypothetical protein